MRTEQPDSFLPNGELTDPFLFPPFQEEKSQERFAPLILLPFLGQPETPFFLPLLVLSPPGMSGKYVYELPSFSFVKVAPFVPDDEMERMSTRVGDGG